MHLEKDKDYFFFCLKLSTSVFKKKPFPLNNLYCTDSLLYFQCVNNYSQGFKVLHFPLSRQSLETLCGLALTGQLISVASCGSWICRWVKLGPYNTQMIGNRIKFKKKPNTWQIDGMPELQLLFLSNHRNFHGIVFFFSPFTLVLNELDGWLHQLVRGWLWVSGQGAEGW